MNVPVSTTSALRPPSPKPNAVEKEAEVVILIEADGTVKMVQDTRFTELQNSGSTTTHRASHVEPDAPVPRLMFHVLRRCFGEKGRVAQWTRRWPWPIMWQANMAPSGGGVLGPFLTRPEAIEAEIAWLQKNVL